MLKIDYDEEADAAYIKLKDGEFAGNKEVSNSIILDLDKDDNVLGIEFLNVSKFGGFSPLLDLSTTAEYLNTSKVTLKRWVRNGAIPAYKLGGTYRFKKEEVDEFVERRKVKEPLK